LMVQKCLVSGIYLAWWVIPSPGFRSSGRSLWSYLSRLLLSARITRSAVYSARLALWQSGCSLYWSPSPFSRSGSLMQLLTLRPHFTHPTRKIHGLTDQPWHAPSSGSISFCPSIYRWELRWSGEIQESGRPRLPPVSGGAGSRYWPPWWHGCRWPGCGCNCRTRNELCAVHISAKKPKSEAVRNDPGLRWSWTRSSNRAEISFPMAPMLWEPLARALRQTRGLVSHLTARRWADQSDRIAQHPPYSGAWRRGQILAPRSLPWSGPLNLRCGNSRERGTGIPCEKPHVRSGWTSGLNETDVHKWRLVGGIGLVLKPGLRKVFHLVLCEVIKWIRSLWTKHHQDRNHRWGSAIRERATSEYSHRLKAGASF